MPTDGALGQSFAMESRSISLRENLENPNKNNRPLAAMITGSLPAQWAIKILISIMGCNRGHEKLSYMPAYQAP